ARLATELPFEEATLRREICDAALELARGVGARTVAEVLRLRSRALNDPVLAADRLSTARELVAIATELDDVATTLDGQLLLFAAALEAARLDEAGRAIAAYEVLAAR